MTNFNPKNPSKYLGTNKYIIFSVSRNRAPTLADYRQPETGTYYSIGTIWQVEKDPTTGLEGDMWILTKIVANQGYWIQFNASASIVTSFAVQTGTSPVNPLAGIVTFNGAVVVAGTNPVRTDGTGANTMDLEVQISQAVAATDATTVGLSSFDSAQFSVDVNGFVSLPGNTNTFTPAIAFGGASVGVTYGAAEGKYTVIGNICFFDIYIDMSSKGSSTGNVTITGLPINVAGPSSQVVFIQLDDVTYDVGFDAPFLRPLTGSSKTAEIWQSGNGVTGLNLNDTNFANTSNVRCQGFYFV